jgi:hypothetical protein
LLCEFLQMALRDSRRSPVLLRHGSRRKEKEHSLNLGISPISISLSFFLFSSLFLFQTL